ncbi:MAG: hypothetical protein JWQ02_3968 [Capsulimonas sp.]|jgi:putative methyltransferase (TIGR04325 family)|nr:hypothetical protein [Capsulimonas sp.]
MPLSLARKIAKALVPPIFPMVYRRLRSPRAAYHEWEAVPNGWNELKTNPKITGWNVEDIAEQYEKKWPAFLESILGTGPLGISPESIDPTQQDLLFHNIVMSYAFALGAASHSKDSLSMLDWGGGFGHYYQIGKALFPNLQLDYHCKDVPVLIEHGRRLLPQATFYDDDECLKRSYDFVMASTSLHYSEDWRGTLQGLANAATGHVYITRLPITEGPAFVFVQRPYRYGYNSEYISWCLNRKEFLDAAESHGLRLLREVYIGERPQIHGAPAPSDFRGFLFEQRSGSAH